LKIDFGGGTGAVFGGEKGLPSPPPRGPRKSPGTKKHNTGNFIFPGGRGSREKFFPFSAPFMLGQGWARVTEGAPLQMGAGGGAPPKPGPPFLPTNRATAPPGPRGGGRGGGNPPDGFGRHSIFGGPQRPGAFHGDGKKKKNPRGGGQIDNRQSPGPGKMWTLCPPAGAQHGAPGMIDLFDFPGGGFRILFGPVGAPRGLFQVGQPGTGGLFHGGPRSQSIRTRGALLGGFLFFFFVLFVFLKVGGARGGARERGSKNWGTNGGCPENRDWVERSKNKGPPRGG